MANFMRKNELIELIEKGLHYHVNEDINALVDKGMGAEEIAMGIFEGTVDMDLDELQRGIDGAIERERQEEAMRRLHYGEEYKGYYSKNDGKTIDVILVMQMRDCVGVCYKKNDKGGYTYFPMYGNDERFQKLLEDGYVKDKFANDVGTFEVSDLDGLSQEDAKDIIMDAIAVGVMRPRYCMIAPYTHGFELNYNGRTYDVNVDPFQMPEYIVGLMVRGKMDKFSGIHFDKLKEETEKARENLKETYIPYETTHEYKRHQKNRWDRGLIANYKCIMEGYALNGIIAGNCGGDYSSWTPNTQNEWMEAAVALNGYCLDYLVEHRVPWKEQILDYHQSRGLDLRNPEVLEEWKLSHKGICFDKELKMQFDKEDNLKTQIKNLKSEMKAIEKGLEDIECI